MLHEIPSDLLELLKSAVEQNIEQYDIELVNNEKGQGFVGEILFVTLTNQITRETKKLVVKQEQIRNGEIVERLSYIFQREIAFYADIWPILEDFYQKITGKQLSFIPKCFGTTENGRKRIILENLKAKGYELYNKREPFDDEHFRAIFKTYGIYHAISKAFRVQNNEQYNKFTSQYSNVFSHAFKETSFCNNFLESLKEIREYFDPVEEKAILDVLHRYEESGIQLLHQWASEDFPNGVLIHGDCWSNNMMFEYAEHRKVQNIKLLDFQLICNGTPVFDLAYCLYSGSCKETLMKLDDYLQIYHSSLSDTLKEFGLDSKSMYSVKTLKEEWKHFSKFGFALGVIVWRVKLVGKDNIPDFSNEQNHVKISEDMKEEYKKRIRELIIHMYTNGFL